MSEPVSYPWYRVRLHFVTCIATVVAAVGLTWPQAEGGWPLRFFYPRVLHDIVAPGTNLSVALVLVLGVGIFTEQLIRNLKLQFSLGSLLCMTFVVSVMVGDYVSKPPSIVVDTLDHFDTRLSLLFWEVSLVPSVVICFALFCTLFVAVSFGLRMLGWMFRRGDRSP